MIDELNHTTDTSFEKRSRTYLRRSALTVFCLLIVVALFNVTIDPYLRFSTPRIEGLSRVKPKAIRQVRMAKAYDVMELDYKTIFLGNSRVDVGLDPESDQLPSELKPAYNLGQPGIGTGVALRYLQHVLANQSPTNVILGVDFLNYIRDAKQLKQQSVERKDGAAASPVFSRLSTISGGAVSWRQIPQRLFDTLASALSLSALGDSIATVLAQGNPNSADISKSGFNSGAAFRTLIQNEGQASLFHQKNVEYARKCAIRIAPPLGESEEMHAIEALIRLCQQRGIQVELYIHPYHADILEIFDATGHWTNFEIWKTQLTAICDSNGAKLWDFSECNQYTTEPPPGSKDRKTVMHWYWESGHYRSTLGDLMFKRMFDTEFSGNEIGIKLLPDNLSTWIIKSRESLQDYRRDHAERSAVVRGLTAGLDPNSDTGKLRQ